jgi:hypothetical protein
VRIVRTLASICAVLALILACTVADPWGALSGDDDSTDDIAKIVTSAVLPATPAEPHVPLAPVGSVFIERQPPPSRLTTLDVFRPPRADA